MKNTSESRTRSRFGPTSVGGVLVIVAGLLGVTTPPAFAHFSSGIYTYSGSCTSSNRTDPVNLVFYQSATGSRTLNHIQFHTGWTNTSGSSQKFLTHSECYSMSGQRASGGLTSSRWHVRVRQTYHSDTTWGTTSAGAAHWENYHSLLNCHYVTQNGFNEGRMIVVEKLVNQGGHNTAGTTDWGNTQRMRQCNGNDAWSNGIVYWIAIPGSSH